MVRMPDVTPPPLPPTARKPLPVWLIVLGVVAGLVMAQCARCGWQIVQGARKSTGQYPLELNADQVTEQVLTALSRGDYAGAHLIIGKAPGPNFLTAQDLQDWLERAHLQPKSWVLQKAEDTSLSTPGYDSGIRYRVKGKVIFMDGAAGNFVGELSPSGPREQPWSYGRFELERPLQ